MVELDTFLTPHHLVYTVQRTLDTVSEGTTVIRVMKVLIEFLGIVGIRIKNIRVSCRTQEFQ